MNLKGLSLELYFINGHPDGMVKASMFDWPGEILSFPRTQVAEALDRAEFDRLGVYLLLGDKDGAPCLYVGESENLGERLGQHVTNKDWWTRAVLVTSTSGNLTKAHIKHLEAHLVAEAKKAGIALDNGQQPSKSHLSEAHRVGMEAFAARLLMVLPLLRVDAFLKPGLPKAADAPIDAPFFIMKAAHGLVDAEALWMDGLLVVRKGSRGRAFSPNPGYTSFRPLYEKLRQAGVLAEEQGQTIFTTDYAFDSPSAAATVLNGQAISGQIAWKLKGSQMTYKAWEHERTHKGGAS